MIVSDVAELDAAMQAANNMSGNLTILLQPGTYLLAQNLPFIASKVSHLTIRGISGNRDDVIIRGPSWNQNDVTHIFNVAADYFTVADMSIGHVFYHPIQVHSNPDPADHFIAYNVRFFDAKEQLLKVSAGGTEYAKNGVVSCCLFEFTDSLAFQYYTGGIDAHRAKDWVVGNNLFLNIKSPDSNLAEHAIHFWRGSIGTLVEGNQIIRCDRGIGFGLGNDMASGHQGGTIRNNFVHTDADVGIGLEYAPNTLVYHNTVIAEAYPRAIEYRFAGTSNVHIANNLTFGSISDRSSGSSGTIEYNYALPDLSVFADASNFDYHLEELNASITMAGTLLPSVPKDIDCQSRPTDIAPDLGADQFTPGTSTSIYVDGSGIELFPNPTNGTFQIKGVLDLFTVEILDAQGEVQETFYQNRGTIEIDISSYPMGLYFVKINSRNNAQLWVRLILKT